MPRAILSLALLSLGPSLTVAWGHDNQGRGYPVYGGYSVQQPEVTTTVTVTEVSIVTVCTGYATASGATSISNAGCTHGSLTSTGTASRNVSTSVSRNNTCFICHPTKTGSTSSGHKSKSTRPSTTAQNLTTLTSTTAVTVNTTATSGNAGPTAPTSVSGTGTGLPTCGYTAVSSYHTSLNYTKTSSTPSRSASHRITPTGKPTKTSATVHTKSQTLAPGGGGHGGSGYPIPTPISSGTRTGTSPSLVGMVGMVVMVGMMEMMGMDMGFISTV